jgi:hypothetical protein
LDPKFKKGRIMSLETYKASKNIKGIEHNGSHSLCLDFKTRDGRVYGFAYAHLLSYLLEKNPDGDKDGLPPEKLSIWFSTHDVILFGWRLDSARVLLRDGRISSILAEDPRYLNLEPDQGFVSEIQISPGRMISWNQRKDDKIGKYRFLQDSS